MTAETPVRRRKPGTRRPAARRPVQPAAPAERAEPEQTERAEPLAPAEPEPAQPLGTALADRLAQPWQPPVLRTCSFCQGRVPVGELAGVADSMQCRDQAACDARAAQSGVYPMDLREQEAAEPEIRRMLGAA